MRRDEVTLLDIAQAARLVIEFTQGMNKEQFLGDIKTQSAVLLSAFGHRGSCQATFP